MDIKQILSAAWGWLKSQSVLTLVVGYAAGALTDDLLIGLVKAGLSIF